MNQQNRVHERKKKKEALVFDMKSRSEFLGGFSKRKAERRKKGNLINLKKEQKRKREEQTMFKQHIQTEYQKAIDAAKHNFGNDVKEVTESIGDLENTIEERMDFYPKDLNTKDPFGDVSVQISSFESPQFALLKKAIVPPAEEGSCPAPTSTSEPRKKKLPLFAKFKHLTKSSQLFAKRKEKRKDSRRQTGALKKKKMKKGKKSHS